MWMAALVKAANFQQDVLAIVVIALTNNDDKLSLLDAKKVSILST